MTISYGFYNSVGGDRKYDAEQMSSLFDGVITDGVFLSIPTNLMVRPGASGLTVIIGEGRAWFNHSWTLNDSEFSLNIAVPDVIYPRIDRVVLEVDASVPVRANSIKVVRGVPANPPLATDLIKSNLVNQYPLANILVSVGATSIGAGKITNMVGTSECPFVVAAAQGLNMDAVLAQWDANFGIWFQGMKDQLSVDAAGSLQLQLNNLSGTVNANGWVTTARIADKSITPIKLANRVRRLHITPFGNSSVAGVITPIMPSYQFGWLTKGNATSSFAGMVNAPLDILSGSTIFVKPLWSNFSSSGSKNIFILGGVSVVGNDKADVEVHFSDQVLPIPQQKTAFTPVLSAANVIPSDMISLYATRIAVDSQDSHEYYIGFFGWLVEYTADN